MKENGLVNFFRQFFRLLRETEDKRVDLAIRHDFCIVDLFRIADTGNRLYINYQDLDIFYSKLMLPGTKKPSPSEIKLLMGYYDKDDDNIISYDEFSLMVCPVEFDCRDMLLKREDKGYKSFDQYNIGT